MNNRDYKKFNKESIAHIYNRGNNKAKIFFDEQDYKAFLFRIALALGFDQKELQNESLLNMPYSRIRIESRGKDKFKIHAFCLMPNHFHLLIEQCNDVSISKIISKVCSSYSKYINNKYNRVGHAFQDCFKAVLIKDSPQLMWSSSYIHMNAVKDGLVKHPEEYRWSSYGVYTSKKNLSILSKDLLIETFGGKKNLIKQTLNFSVKETL
ncbi:hypothetical protein A3D42_00500 [Candidatus Nomurabacteria bacterium RIFCSPHIGHO2_02_FULL_41_18]|uniref:Transposase IS200-like domain-containing protein n=1 Tax=Candidatus Nomurabacteria bacterium RIFCSPHIGHO2_02_FULL_41_18 TaxID=1801754 RepID=A0A1F6W7H6_9BACT|nr:MAG: hypothetical protein A2737_02595 [Candidatus Nomurabacteria bacterium RIFCSPHIGHO2_01_FULL_41_71]OGI77900.1 MAG: hypothetical protein A3D42_00500 [Candidatus Nomurabacteria bacterium RIFCSPHIGHO2_02_FULL_41_18]OGI90074.1 MAG: hypothetical protein A3B01_00920 [Candidatus Nomurabacteria bacterium RIFCSPLOWO2_01_FULL_41_52b]OGJ00189.1 MAG: hypothetical protein A3I90_00095 [Candidatus Nomurabacteria bacterium RIFCSPLOWO2_02_FULL_41_9]